MPLRTLSPQFVWAVSVYALPVQEKRRENLTKGLELMDMGKRFEAEQSFQRAISITAEMANKLQHALLDKGVQCFVAPFEAGVLICAQALVHWRLSLGQRLDKEGGV